MDWFPQKVKLPTASPADIIRAATADILMALQKPNTNSPLLPLTDTETGILRQLSTLLADKSNNQPEAQTKPAPVSSPSPSPPPDPAPIASIPPNAPVLRVGEGPAYNLRSRGPIPAANAVSTDPTQMTTNHVAWLLCNLEVDTRH